DAGQFHFTEFYFRRAKRLLPAAYVTFAVTAMVVYFVLDASEWHDFIWQLAGAVTFTGNLVLLHQTGYFEGAAAFKPLLHVWSLAVEEQYYLLLPAALVLLPRRFWLAGNGIVLVASLTLCITLSFSNPNAAFYLLPTRAWELAIGSFAALAGVHREAARKWIARLFLPALITIVAIPVWPLPVPGFVNIALVCIASLLIILRRHEELEDRPIPNALARVGDASYSLYLVHWPIFAFVNNFYIGNPALGMPGPWVQGGATLLALLLGYVLYRQVELPMRRMEFRSPRRWVLIAIAVSVGLAVIPFAITRLGMFQNEEGYVSQRRDNVGFDAHCDGYERLAYTDMCSNTPHPQIMVWGDSFAMHLVPGIAATTRLGVLQATKSACGPLPGLAQITGEYTREFAERCLTFNQSVLDYLAATPSIRIVVLSSPFYEYFDPDRRMLRSLAGTTIVQQPDAEVAMDVLRRTVGQLRALGKRVVIVAPPPSDGFDYTHCLERKARHRVLFGSHVDCNIPLVQYHASKRKVLDFLQRLSQQADVEVVSFDPFLCNDQECMTELDGTFLYRDEGHLSIEGSVVLAKAMHLGGLLVQAAR
ncbi:MAG: acyltransferase family protein, partial [Lysobacteraceae bacterium]